MARGGRWRTKSPHHDSISLEHAFALQVRYQSRIKDDFAVVQLLANRFNHQSNGRMKALHRVFRKATVAIDALCRINREYLQSLLPKADIAEAKERAERRRPQSGYAREAYCHWLCHVVRKDDFGRTVGLPYEEVVEHVKAAGHPNASVNSAKSHATYIRQGTQGCAGHKLPDIRP